MDLKNYIKRLEENHKGKVQSGFEKNDRNIFIEEILDQLGYSYDNIYYDVPQKVRGKKSKTPDIRVYGNTEKKSKNMMSRFVIETKNYRSLEGEVNNIDFLQLKKYVLINSGKIKYIASTDYISFFLFDAESLLNGRKLNITTPNSIFSSEIAQFKRKLIYKFDFKNFSKQDELKFKMLSHKNLFEIYDFPHPQKNRSRFNIKNKAVRENFIRSLYYLTEEVKNDILVKFDSKLTKFKSEYQNLNGNNFNSDFSELVYKEEYIWIRNLFLWAIEMNYIPNFFKDPILINRKDIDKIITVENPDTKNFYYVEYIITAIYSIINKTFFIRILEDSSGRSDQGYKFIKEEKDGRYISNGIVHQKFLEGKLKEYVSYLFEFKNKDLKPYSFLLKHDIYDWILSEIEEYTLVDFLRTFNEIYLKELDQDILGDIYEHYLQEDRDERKGKSYRRLLGQYYTPRPIVRLMWFLVRDVLKQNKNLDLYKKEQKLLNILDPFMGSGTFLNEAVLQMKLSDSGKQIYRGEVFYFFKDRSFDKRIEESLTGFEINPLSCSIADINIYFRLIKSFSSNRIEEVPITKLNLFRTNSFDLGYNESDLKDTIQLPLLAEEIKSSFTENKKIKEVKMKKYDIIISNPPYGKITPNDYMKKQLVPFAYPENNFDLQGKIIPYSPKNCRIKTKIPDFEKNRGRIEDMFAFAYGVANELIKNEGIMAFITSNTILTLPSYKWSRKYFLDNYTIHYIVNFNKIMEKSNSMFSPESAIATTIIVMSNRKRKENDKIKYLDLSMVGSINGKYDYFNKIVWRGNKKDKNDIESFKTKELQELEFVEIDQNEFLSNFDYEFIRLDPILKEIEKDSEMLEKGDSMNCGISTANDEVFISDRKDKLEKQIKTFIQESGFDYQFSSKNIKEYIFSILVKDYSIENIMYIYYDKELIELMKEKCKREGKNFNARFRDEKKLSKKNKLIITAYHFYVDDKGRYPSLNCIDGKNTYYLISDEDVLYYVCGIMNSRLGKFYRRKTQIDNYERFPIKKIEGNEELFKRVVTEVKIVHKLKSDYQKLKKGEIDFESDYFRKNISDLLEIYSIEEPNKYFDLELPKGLSANFFVESPRISSEDNRVILLNNTGLKISCKDEVIAKTIFEKYFKNIYGDLQELNISINMTQINKEKITRIEQKIQEEIEFIEKKIDILVYGLYFNINIEFQEQEIKNGIEILSNKYIKEIEEYLEGIFK